MRRAWLAAAFFIVAGIEPVLAQRCPPNSTAQAVAFPGNLRTAQCFCNPGYESVRGACVRPAPDARRPAPRDPASTLVAPR